MPHDPIRPKDDPRVTHEFAILNGRKYHYVQGFPKEQPPKATILCIHGFPDFWYSWRYVIPGLLEMGLRVIVPDMIGYGQTDMPVVTSPASMAEYSWKSSSDDMVALLSHLSIPRVILLGHDWGGAIVTRIYIHHPKVVTSIISLCTAYYPPLREYIPITEVARRVPSLTYQVALCDPQTERDIRTPEEIERFLRGLHRGLGDGLTGKIQVTSDLMKELGDQPRGKLMTKEDLAYYVEQYARNGMHGPLNWYKCRYENFLDERNIEKSTIDVPYLYVGATHDIATPPSMATMQHKFIPNLTEYSLKACHWIPEETPDQLLVILREWLPRTSFEPATTAFESKL